MKKILVALVFVMGSSYAFSQAGVSVGLKGGLNLASVSIDDPNASYNSRTGYHFGAYGTIKLTKLAIQPEILYSAQGSSVDFDAISDDFKSDLIYLNIPIMVKLYLAAGLNIQVGPQFGMLIKAEQEIPTFDGSGSISGKTTQDFKNDLKDSDLSAAFGVGWDAPFGLNVSARYLLGLNDINDLTGGEDTKNRTFQISIGYKLFGIGN